MCGWPRKNFLFWRFSIVTRSAGGRCRFLWPAPNFKPNNLFLSFGCFSAVDLLLPFWWTFSKYYFSFPKWPVISKRIKQCAFQVSAFFFVAFFLATNISHRKIWIWPVVNQDKRKETRNHPWLDIIRATPNDVCVSLTDLESSQHIRHHHHQAIFPLVMIILSCWRTKRARASFHFNSHHVWQACEFHAHCTKPVALPRK